MAKQKKFSPILGDLSKLTPEAQNEYVLAICEFLNVPPELGLIGLSWMDTGDGARQLTPYVRKGATDIIRDRRGIDVDSLDEANGPGYVGWKVKGHDSAGRHEIAVGAVSIDGLKGRAVADAVKTAQTQACRRMTLQFAGGGFLDESEIHEKTSSLSNSAAALELLPRAPAPTVTPNVEAGKDITNSESVPKPEQSTVLATDAESSGQDMPPRVNISPAPILEETPKKRGRRHDGDEYCLVVEEPKIPQSENSSTAAPISQTENQIAEEIPKKRGRRRKTVSLDSPSTPPSAPEPAVLAVAASLPEQPVEAIVTAGEPLARPEKQAPSAPIAVPVVRETLTEAPSDGGEIPTKEQEEEFRNRLSKYINEILPPAGFLQSEKCGTRNNKMKLFMKAMFPKANLKMISVGQWKYLLTFLDDHAKVGVESLVQLINKQIGDI